MTAKGKASVQARQARERKITAGEDTIWGVHPVFEALRQESARVAELILVKDKRGTKWDEMIELARSEGVKCSFVSSLAITAEDGGRIRHQGVAARMSRTPLLPFAALLEKFREGVERGEKPRLVICDSLQDPHNLGAVIRSALASGATGVVITRERSAPLSGTAAKSSAGAISHIDISQVTNLSEALKQLKEAGGWIFGAVKDEDEKNIQSLYRTDLRLPACIVVGSEGKGIRPLVLKQCDVLIAIPTTGNLDSLNSSVAAGVILFEAMRQNIGD